MLTAKEIGHASCFFALQARRYVGVRGRPDATHKDSRASRVRSPSAASRSHNQRPGGWWYHPERRSRTGTDEMRNHRIR